MDAWVNKWTDRTEQSLEIDMLVCGSLIYEKGAISDQWGKDSL